MALFHEPFSAFIRTIWIYLAEDALRPPRLTHCKERAKFDRAAAANSSSSCRRRYGLVREETGLGISDRLIELTLGHFLGHRGCHVIIPDASKHTELPRFGPRARRACKTGKW